jgi:hypothetical protein
MPSGRAIDHVVLAVRDLDRAAGTFQGLGFTLTPRAMHEDRMGTSNRLAQSERVKEPTMQAIRTKKPGRGRGRPGFAPLFPGGSGNGGRERH